MRLFVGTFLSPANQECCDRWTTELLQSQRNVLRPIPGRSAHLTCVFCASVADADLDGLAAAVRDVAGTEVPFGVRFAAPRVLLAGRVPRLVCADVTAGASDLRRLTDRLMEAIGARCPGLDLRPSSAAHVTLARFRRQAGRTDAARVTAALAQWSGADMARADRVSRLQVIESTLAATGPGYSVRADCALACDPSG